MGIKLSIEEELRLERQQRLALQAENEELSDIVVQQLLDLEFRQLINEMGVGI